MSPELFSRALSRSLLSTKAESVRAMVSTSDGEMVFPNPLSSKPPALSFQLSLFQPLIYRGIGQSKPGQHVVKPGAIIMGYPGDPVFDNKNLPVRPSFTKNGSFMVFRKLEQNVLVLEDYVTKYWNTIPRDVAGNKSIILTDNQRKQLFAARLVGRFKSVSYAVAKSFN
jgi:hypothetical protein